MKKAQLKMGENIAILLIFFFIIAICLVFYFNVTKQSASRAAQEKASLEAIKIAERISFLPELQCSSENIITEDCFDIFKIDKFTELMTNDVNAKLYYYDVFGYSEITIKQIYPLNEIPWKLYTRTKEDSSYITVNIPVSLYDPAMGEKGYSFGVLTVSIYP